LNKKESPEIKQREMTRTAFWIEKNLLRRCDANLEAANCRSRNEFVSEAIRFYIAYLNAEQDQDFLCKAILETVSGIIAGTENRIARMHFKQAVELAKLTHILASMGGVDDETLRRLHIKCVDEVKRINGVIKYEDAAKYQHGG
jgi:metal-responsive CopG/Arc/MetJ family transcriptional regulator